MYVFLFISRRLRGEIKWLKVCGMQVWYVQVISKCEEARAVHEEARAQHLVGIGKEVV